MRLSAIPFVLTLALAATPALAQSGTGNNPYSHENQQYSTSNTNNYSNQGSNFNSNRENNRFATNQNFNRQNEPGLTQDTQRRIRQSLEQNGFHNVQVMPEAFIIRAQAPDGSRIVMQVGPDMVQGFAVHTGSSSNPSNNNNSNDEMNQSGSSQSGQWNSHDGSTGMDGVNNR
ncbi:MAG TPA: hypothetical protein VJR70_06485 [Stellaceae bacterium]|nr:hypothetical protein [Stellaceae bacterium]